MFKKIFSKQGSFFKLLFLIISSLSAFVGIYTFALIWNCKMFSLKNLREEVSEIILFPGPTLAFKRSCLYYNPQTKRQNLQ
jgi:hypothetical protein